MNEPLAPESLAILTRVLLRDSSSLLQYLRGSGSWVDARALAAAYRMEQLAEAEDRAVQVVADILRRAKIPPAPPHFVQKYSSLNYLGLDHLLPILLSEHRTLLLEQEKDVAMLDLALRQKLQPMLEMKRKSIAELEKMCAEYAGANAGSTRK
jgi:hypothetical protein